MKIKLSHYDLIISNENWLTGLYQARTWLLQQVFDVGVAGSTEKYFNAVERNFDFGLGPEVAIPVRLLSQILDWLDLFGLIYVTREMVIEVFVQHLGAETLILEGHFTLRGHGKTEQVVATE